MRPVRGGSRAVDAYVITLGTEMLFYGDLDGEMTEQQYLLTRFASVRERKEALNMIMPEVCNSKDPRIIEDAVATATSVYTNNLDSEDVITNFVYYVQYLCKDRKSAHSVVPVVEMLSIVDRFRENVDLTARAVSCLAVASTDEEQRRKIIEHDGVEAVASRLKDRSLVPRLVEQCAVLLSNLCVAMPDAAQRAADSGCIGAVLDIMRSGDVGLAYCSCIALRNITASSEENCMIARKEGAVWRLRQVLPEYTEHKVRYQALRVMQKLVSGHTEDLEHLAKEEVVVNALVDLISSHRDSAGLQGGCVAFLSSLVGTGQAGRNIVAKAGGVAAFVSALQSQNMKRQAVAQVLVALRYLLFEETCREQLDACQGIEVAAECFKQLTSQMDSDDSDELRGTIKSCMMVFSNATIDNDANKMATAKSGAVVAVTEAMQFYLSSKEMQEQGCRCLRNMADRCELNRRVQVESGAIEQILIALLGYPDEPLIQVHGIAALVNLASGQNVIQKIIRLNVMQQIERMLMRHPDHEDVKSQCMALLSKIDIFPAAPEAEEVIPFESRSTPSKTPDRTRPGNNMASPGELSPPTNQATPADSPAPVGQGAEGGEQRESHRRRRITLRG